MALLFTIPRVSTIDLVGAVAPRARLYFYQTGTSTPQAVYSDSAMLIALDQPVTASDAGLFRAIYLDDSLGSYKIVCQDEDGAELWTVDPYLTGPSQSQIGATLYPRTTAESIAGITPVNYFYPAEPAANVFRYISSAQVALIKAGNVTAQNAATVTDGAQNAMDAYLNVLIPAGNYQLNDALSVRPWSCVRGAGKSEYVSSLSEASTGTRLIQTASDFAITTDLTDIDDQYPGHVLIEDLTVLGGTSASQTGTYGLRISSSIHTTLERVQASWFTLAGIRYIGSLRANVINCECTYNQDAGLRLDYGDLGSSEDANAYMSNITGGAFSQNKNAGIYLGTSTVKVNIRGCDIESNGTFFSSGTGYGVHIAEGSKNVTIEGNWFEGNKVHVICGATTSLSNVPLGTRIIGNEFWSTSTGSTKIQLNAGRDTIIESNEFFGGGKIVLGMYTGAPVIRNNYGEFTVEDQNGTVVTVGASPLVNDFPDPQISGWTLTNCTVAVEHIASPAGNVPVYKVTPSATGAVSLQSSNTPWSWATRFHTYGFWCKTDATAAIAAVHNITSVNMPKGYTDSTVDNYKITKDWSWQSIGRSITSTDTGNQAFTIAFTAATTDPVYISGFAAMPGIVYEPHRVITDRVIGLSNTAQPVVYGLSRVSSGGGTTITNFLHGVSGQVIHFIAEHAITITDGTNIFLAGSTNFAMNPTDTLTLICKSDAKWYEIARSDNT